MKKITIFLVLLISVFLLSACDNDDDNDYFSSNKDVKENEEVIDTESTIDLTLAELEMYDGKDGTKAYIVVDGVIYDVTDEWDNGTHNGMNAGGDVTTDIMGAPHGESVLENLVVIGNLISE